MFEYAPFACDNETCDMHAQVQYRAWERSHNNHYGTRWLDHDSCASCNRALKDYMTVMRDLHAEVGYVPPMTTMRCANHKCSQYGVESLQNFDSQFRGTGYAWYRGTDGKCSECARGMMTEIEWLQWRV